MRKFAFVLTLLFGLSALVPASANQADFQKIADYSAGFDPTSNGSRGGPGSRIATNQDGSIILYSDFRYFNNYAFGGYPTVGGALVGPMLYLSTNTGASFQPLAAAPQAQWGPVEISEDGTVIAAAPWRSFIQGNQAVTDSGIWLSTDSGQTFTQQDSGNPAVSNWDLSMDSSGEIIIATQDDGSYIPKFIDLASQTPSWSNLNLNTGAWRNTSISSDASVIAVCDQSSGVYISRDRAASFALEIPNEPNEGCGPMEVSDDGQTLVIGRFADPNKKVFRFSSGSWSQVGLIEGVSSWFSTASVSLSADGQVITVGDYLSGKLHISEDGGQTFSALQDSQTFSLSGEAYVSPDGTKIFSFNSDGLYLWNRQPGPIPTPTWEYQGPLIQASSSQVESGKTVSLVGKRLETIQAVSVAGRELKFSVSGDTLILAIPEQHPVGLFDIEIASSFGKLTVQNALRIIEPAEPEEIRLTMTAAGPKLYHMSPSGLGKIQILVNGVEVFWLDTADGSSGKLRIMGDGKTYLVRTLRDLESGDIVSLKVNGSEIFRESLVRSQT